MKLECCNELMQYIIIHKEPRTSLQQEKINACQILIESIKSIEDPVEIQALVHNALTDGTSLRKNSANPYFSPIEGKFVRSLKSAKVIIDNYIEELPPVSG